MMKFITVLFVLLFLIQESFYFPSVANSQTYNDDYSLVTEFNRARILRNIPGSLIVNHDLQQAARVLSQNQVYFDCNASHVSCNGETLERRLKRFYPGYQAAGEVWSLGLDDPRTIVDGFLSSFTHAGIILGSMNEVGGSLLDRWTAFGRFKQAVGDFGGRVLFPINTPVISGAVYNGRAWMTYDAQVPPTAAFVSIGGQDFSLKLTEGSLTRGIFSVPITKPSGCEKVVFNVVSNGQPIQFPSSDWYSYVGDLCAPDPILLDKVRIKINSSGNRLYKGTLTFNLQTLPNQNYNNLIISWGEGAGVSLPAGVFLHHTSRNTILRGTYRDNTIPAAKPGRIRVYLDYRLVASVYPNQIQNNYVGVIR
jgi:hypothetical protein